MRYCKGIILIILIIATGILFSQDQSRFKDIGWRVCNSKNWRKYIDYKSDEWKNLSVNEKNELTKINKDELKKMNTRNLIEATIDCRSARRVGLFSEISNYYNSINKTFNGLEELFLREDTIDELINYYASLDLNNSKKSFSGLTIIEQKQIIEYLMAHPVLIERYDVVQSKQLMQISLTKYDELSRKTQSDFNSISNIYLISKILEKSDPSFKNSFNNIEEYEVFRKSGLFLTPKVKNQIVTFVNHSEER